MNDLEIAINDLEKRLEAVDEKDREYIVSLIESLSTNLQMATQMAEGYAGMISGHREMTAFYKRFYESYMDHRSS